MGGSKADIIKFLLQTKVRLHSGFSRAIYLHVQVMSKIKYSFFLLFYTHTQLHTTQYENPASAQNAFTGAPQNERDGGRDREREGERGRERGGDRQGEGEGERERAEPRNHEVKMCFHNSQQRNTV